MPVYTHAACFAHDTGPGHVESPARLGAVVAALRDHVPGLDWVEAPRATRGQLLRVHEPLLLHSVLEGGAGHAVQLDPDTVLSPGSPEAALRAAGAVVAAVDRVMGGESAHAFCAVRPPGHHATPAHAMGFCLFNNVAVGAAHALDRHGLSRVAIVDFDIHHGNGTQAIFAGDPRVLYASAHEMPLFPGSGDPADRGARNVHNAALRAGTGSHRFREAWRERLLPAVDAFGPELLMVSAGFDGHRADPTAHVELEADDYAWLTSALVAIAGAHAGGRLVSVLEGGYDLAALAECAIAHVQALAAGGDP
ncbi:MAG: histone deacetylase family protein [Gammaproteobacteria bacterium]|nr:histone deacetylase family protein [Gammaproteobacteria bacterium]